MATMVTTWETLDGADSSADLEQIWMWLCLLEDTARQMVDYSGSDVPDTAAK